MKTTLSRRDFLKLSGLGAASAVLGPIGRIPPGDDPFAPRRPSIMLGRTTKSIKYYQASTLKSKELGFYNSSTVLKFYEERTGLPDPKYNPLWLRTSDGWVNAAFIQPVEDKLNVPFAEVPPGGFLAEVSVPVTQAWKDKRGNLVKAYRFFYGSTHWVDFVDADEHGWTSYRVYDDREKIYYFVTAEHLRPIPMEELAPLSPQVYDKRIEVYLDTQTLIAFEYGQPVFTTLVSTGAVIKDTPVGDFVVERKRPSRHMAASEGNGFDLPAVPWVCYISWTGVSLHGTYWHNNFGHPMSHGCINLPLQASKWIYRWTLPVVLPNDDYVEADGTLVVVLGEDTKPG